MILSRTSSNNTDAWAEDVLANTKELIDKAALPDTLTLDQIKQVK